jgi:iron complex outermembrane receptor protein
MNSKVCAGLNLSVFSRRLLLAGTALCVVTATPAIAQTAPSGPSEAARSFDIPAQPLRDALRQLMQQGSLQIGFETADVDGRTSSAVSGSMSVGEALSRLLAGTGLTYRYLTAGSVVLERAPQSADGTIQLGPVRVEGNAGSDAPSSGTLSATRALQHEGRAETGYRADTVSSVGALGARAIIDTPFSIALVPNELMQNIQAQSPDDIYKINPYTRTITPQSTGWSPVVSIRGFQSSDTAEDGLRRPYNHAAVIEDKERIEILGGLSGFLYGAAAPGGMINYVYKRPTVERLNSITLGNYGGNQYYVHGDFGGRIDAAGTAGYRLNVVKQAGDTAVDDQHINRTLVSAAIDWQATERLLVELNAVYNHYKSRGPSAYWFYSVPHGQAPDAGKLWSQPWIRDEFDNVKLMGKLTYQLSDAITLRLARMQDFIDRPVQDHTLNNVISNSEYTQLRQRSGKTKNRWSATSAMADIRFDTGPFSHQISAGYYGYTFKDWGTTYNPHTGWVGPYPLSAPTYVPEASFPADTSSPYLQADGRNDNLIVGDTISFGDMVSALVGVNRSTITTKAYGPTGGAALLDYDRSRTSPSVSIMLKPRPWLTAYASYIEGLEMGGVAPDTASNFGTIMPPMVSRQKELGVKAQAGGLLMTAALFDIEKAYEFTNASNVYTQDGRQKHKGFEFTATGRLTSHLTVVGGVTLLDASVKGGDYDGKVPMNVAEQVAKLYAEYDLPFLPGVTLTGGVYYTGKQWATDANDDRLPAYTTFDFGARYTTNALGRPVTLRLTVNNVADKNYWQDSYYVGTPRSVAFSVQTRF